MKKITRKGLDELAKIMPIINETEQRTYVGGTMPPSGLYGSHTYTYQEYLVMINSGLWHGGYVEGYGNVPPEGIAPGQHAIEPTGWFSSYYIGPTSDEVLNILPTPTHAADYIAQQHDLEYKRLGLNGFTGTISSESREADELLIKRCDELISYYNMGIRTYNGYTITEQAYNAAVAMRTYFVVEQGITGIVQ